jgi:GNAT superfamily N-acetyltransferase
MTDINQSILPVFREANENDFPVIAAFYEKLDAHLRCFTYSFPEVENIGDIWLNMFRRTLGRFSILYVCEIDGALVGFISARLKQVPEYMGGVLIGELKDMWVEPDVRGLKIGVELVRLAIRWCKDKNVHSCEGQILIGNQPIIELLESFGMKKELYQLRLSWDDYKERSS